MRPMRWDLLPGNRPFLSSCFGLTLVATLAGVPLAVFCFFWKLQYEVWIIWMRPPAFGHIMALIWLMISRGWAQAQEKRLRKIPERDVERVYRHAELEAQRRGIQLVLWGTVVGSWLAMVAGWILAGFLYTP